MEGEIVHGVAVSLGGATVGDDLKRRREDGDAEDEIDGVGGGVGYWSDLGWGEQFVCDERDDGSAGFEHDVH